MGELAGEDFHVGEEVAGLDVGDDAEGGEAGNIRGVDEFGVFDPEIRCRGVEVSGCRGGGVLVDVEDGADGRVAYGVDGEGEVE